MANTSVKIDGIVKVAGVNVTTLGENGSLYARIAPHGRVFIPKELGFKIGDVLKGQATFVTATYDTNKDGTPKAIPLVRPELDSFVSFADLADVAIEEAKIAAIPTMKWSPADFAAKLKAVDLVS